MTNIIRKIIRSTGFDIVKYPYWINATAQRNYQKLLESYNIDMIFDVGGNIGQYALETFEFGYSGKIVTFEPMSKEHKILTEISKKHSKWEIAPRMAIGEKDGFVDFNISENSVSSSILKANNYVLDFDPTIQYIAQEKVRLSTISSVFDNYKHNAKNFFLKIDVQGYEENVIKGASAVLNNFKGIHLEFSLNPLYEQEKEMLEIFSLVSSFGFKPHYFIPHSSIDSIGRLMQIDGIFYK